MFTAGRYLVVDDNRDELRLLVDALHGIGAPCVGIHYTGKPLRRETFAGVRILFSDLYLIAGNTNEKTQFAAIEAMLRTNVDPRIGGPYLLILWTTHSGQAGKLRDYLDDRLDAALRPLAVLALDKKPFLEGAGADALAQAVQENVNSSPQIRSLVSWEADVLNAAGATLAAITDLVPEDERTIAGFSANLDGVLSRLAVASAGAPNAANDARGAINGVLAPILADRIMNTPAPQGTQEIWAAAITQHENLAALTEAQTGSMNRMLHIAMPPAEPVAPGDWGAVLEIAEADRADGPMLARFGITWTSFLAQQLRFSDEAGAAARGLAIRIGATCDHAQGNAGPKPYMLASLVPAALISSNRLREIERLKPVFSCPLLLLDGAAGPVRLFAHARFQIGLPDAPVGWQPTFRIREPLLSSINAHAAGYQARPGFISL